MTDLSELEALVERASEPFPAMRLGNDTVARQQNANTRRLYRSRIRNAEQELLLHVPELLSTIRSQEAALVEAREALEPWRRVWAVSFAPFDNGPGNGTSRHKEDDGAGPLMPTAWPTIADLRRAASALSKLEGGE